MLPLPATSPLPRPALAAPAASATSVAAVIAVPDGTLRRRVLSGTSPADFGCTEVSNTTDTPQALYASLDIGGDVCIKLLPQLYNLTELASAYDDDTWLPKIQSRRVAIVAEQGQATLDAGGSRRHLVAGSGETLLFNLRLTNGKPTHVSRANLRQGRTRQRPALCSPAPPVLDDVRRWAAAAAAAQSTCAFNHALAVSRAAERCRGH